MSAKKTFLGFWRIFSRTLVVLFVLIFLSLAVLFWRLSLKPLDLEFLMPEIQQYVLPSSDEFKLEADSVLLSARFSRRGLFHISIHNMSLLGKDDSLILDIPNIKLSYGLRNLFTLNYMPMSAYVSDMLLQLTLTKQGQLLLQGQTSAKAVPIAEMKKEGKNKKVIYHPHHYLKKFLAIRQIVLEKAGVIIADELNNRRIMVPKLDVTLERKRFTQYQLNFQTNLLMQKDLMHLQGESLININGRNAVFELSFDNVNLAHGGRLFDLMSGIELVVQGTVNGTLDFQTFNINQWRNIFKSLAFTVKTVQEGKVTLPAPLNTTYPVAFLNAEGNFTENLESLNIQPIDAQLTNKLHADAQIKIEKIGRFLDTFDFSQVKTSLWAQIKDIPIRYVPDVWPSALGPDAHAWVKENLKDGQASNAVFKLYFTGADLTDLLGDIDFQEMTVHYLAPMKPVKNAYGKVMLYPDKVEIYAQGGQIDHMQLQSGNIYLTELKDDISHARIELEANGPASEILTLINEQPLNLLDGFDIVPENVSGDVTGQVKLQFPLTESLKAKDVQTDITASVSNGSFKTKDASLALTNAAFGLIIGNKDLILKGTALYKDLPVDIQWTEFFAPTKENPVQRKYEVSGQTNDLFFKPYFEDVSDYFIGNVNGNIVYEQQTNGNVNLYVQGDFTDAELMLYPLAYTKFKGIPSQLEATVKLNQKQEINSVQFDLSAAKKTLDVKGTFALKGNAVQLKLDHAKAPGTDFSGQIMYEAGKEVNAQIKGKSWLLTELKNMPYLKNKAEETEPKPVDKILPVIDVDISLNSLTINPTLPLKQVAVKAKRSGGLWNEFFIFALGKESVSVSLTPDKKEVSGIAYDTGDILNRLNLTDDFSGGKATLKAIQDNQGILNGEIKVKNMNLKDPGFVMQALTIIGIIDAFRGKELHFSHASVPFRLLPDFILTVKDGALYGNSLGITFEGVLKRGYMNIKGSVIPAYALNSLPGKIPVIGGLFRGSAHGGLVGASYSIKGEPSDAKIDFHPLSSIAPGILMRLFQ